MSILKNNIQIREVWDDNLEEEMDKIHIIAKRFPYIGLDSSFCTESGSEFLKETSSKDNYLRFLELTKNICLSQIGLTFFDDRGNLPTSGPNHSCAWQFNFSEKFNRKNKEKRRPIIAEKFINELVKCELISNPNRYWVTFGGKNDFGVLVKMIKKGEHVPERVEDFYEKLKELFPVVYDIKLALNTTKNKALEMLGVEKFSFGQLAGAESLLTSRIFVKMMRKNKSDKWSGTEAGVLFGITTN